MTSPAGPRRNPRFASSKFAAPQAGFQPVHRSRLLDRLDRGAGTRLTLVVGSAGAGKTILLADWLATRPERPAAWLSCDRADSGPVRFVAAIIEALRRAAGESGLGEDALQLLIADGEASPDCVASLADDVDRVGAPSVLIIDDFHLTGAAGIDVLTWLLEYRPASLQVVLATRVDPSLRLHRMRANEELVEVRERDLSFSAEETGLLLSRFGVQLSDPEVVTVQRRSEGWVAGLQMAAISMQHRSDAARVADRLELNRHTVTGYFLDEVLYRQPELVVQFMLATSILDELSTAACAAVAGPESGPLLEQVYRNHLFVTMVDEHAGTYRYHQLVKEVLRAELRTRDPAAEQRYHERAARYLAGTGRVGPAARHLLDAGDPAMAFRLLGEGVVVDVASNPALGSALDDVRPEDFAGSPEILVPLAAELMLRGAFESGARAFILAQRTPPDPAAQPELALRSDVVGAMYHMAIGEADVALVYRDRALGLTDTPTGVQDWRVALDAASMYCYLYLGRLTRAAELADAVARAELTPPAGRGVLAPGMRSQVAWALGELDEADVWATRALESATRLGFERHYFAFNSLRTKMLLAWERRDLDVASELNERILGILAGGRPAFDFLAQLDRARIWAASGNVDEALASLPAARSALRSEHSVLLLQADELEARMRLSLGDRDGALGLAGRLPDDRRLVVAAIIALDAGDASRAEELLDTGAPHSSTIRTELERALLQAEAALLHGSRHAPRLVKQTLDAAAGQGFVQTVVDTAPRLVDHLTLESVNYPRTDHLTALLEAGLQVREVRLSRPPAGGLADPLTDAEVRVLRKLPQLLTYGDIASDLHLSLNTVKTHLRHSYMKLGVTSRSAAIKRAASLGFL